MTAPLDIVDIHTHLWPPAWGPGGKYAKPASGFAPEIYRRITTPQALVDEFEVAGVSLAIVTATIESLFGAEGPVDPPLFRRPTTGLPLSRTTVSRWPASPSPTHSAVRPVHAKRSGRSANLDCRAS